MKRVIWTDRIGWKRAALLRDDDPETMAESGIPLRPPDLNEVDWEAVKRDVNNQLVEQGIYTWADVQREQNAVTSAILAALRGRIVRLYRDNGRQKVTEEQT